MYRPSSYLGNVADLMAGLMIVFMFIAISYMIDIKSKEGDAEIRAEKLKKALYGSQIATQLAEDAEKDAVKLSSTLKAQKKELEDKTAELENKTTELKNKTNELEKQKQRLTATNDTIKEITATYTQLQSALYDDLLDEFKDDLPRWNATLERDNTIRFNEPNILFKTGDAKIKDRFKIILANFYPRYLSIVYQKKFSAEIDELRIEGHTSSIWKNTTDKEERYLKNADLSQARALSVLNYCFGIKGTTNYRSLLIRDLRSNGLSFAKPILDTYGNEDQQRSQRVEFRVVTKARERILRVIETYKKNEESKNGQ